ncbi:MAG: T9SS type A sorting domain-containing protein [Candidatus Kapabacteria bacterium]|nr:T9SS type A sorting domain-containing protein [Candidatus Kapabacteria bacterium]
MKILKHTLLALTLLLSAANLSFAQTFSNSPNDTINVIGMMEDMATLNIQQLNISSNTITLKWEKVSENIPSAWEASVCDNKICYASLIDSGTMNPVNPADSGLLLLHITTHVNYGTAIVRYAVWDIANPAFRDTLTYILSVNNFSTVSEINNLNALSIYPNPAFDNINIQTNLQTAFIFSIIDITGNEIRKGFSEVNSISLSTEELSSGVYFIQIKSKNNVFTKNFIKR